MTAPDFIAGLPKAELHLHIEGTLEPRMMFALARRNSVAIPYASVEEVRAAYRFSRLQDFLDIYYAGAAVLLTPQDFHDLAAAYFDRAAADGVVHAEIMFDPQTHTARGVSFETVIAGLLSAIAEAETKRGMTVKLILCFLRHLDEADAFATLAAARPWLDRIAAIGLDSSELGHPPDKFARVFAEARSLGLRLVAHAGEEGPPEYVHQALDLLGIDRLDHGNRSLEDPVLVARLARTGHDVDGVPAVQPKAVRGRGHGRAPDRPDAARGSARDAQFGRSGVFRRLHRRQLPRGDDGARAGRDDLVRLARNSFLGSFLPDDAVAGHLAALDAYVAAAA